MPHSLTRVPFNARCSLVRPLHNKARRLQHQASCASQNKPLGVKAAPTPHPLPRLSATATRPTRGSRMSVKAISTTGGVTSSCGNEGKHDGAAGPPLFGAGTKERVVVVGAGLAGVLAASLFAKKGYQVAVFEKRDLQATTVTDRAYFMALDVRATEAVVAAGLDPSVITSNPRPGGFLRIGHKLIPTADHIILYAVSRIKIGQQLVAAAQQRYPTEISFHFGYEAREVDLAGRTLKVTPCIEGVAELGVDEVHYDLLVAADGSFSRVRKLCEQQDPDLQVSVLANSPTAYCSIFGLPPLPDLPWSRELDTNKATSYMRVAQPHDGWTRPWVTFWDSPEGSFTAMPAIPTSEQATSWVAELVRDRTHPDSTQVKQLNEALSDALALIPQEWQDIIVEQLPNVKFSFAGRIVMCSKLTCDGVVLLGDAGHSVSGALGQGANTAMEDVTVLSQVLDDRDSRNGTLDAAVAEFAHQRTPDVHALQMLDLIHRKFLKHPVKPEATLTLRVLRAWQLFAYIVSESLGSKLSAIWPDQKLFLSAQTLLAELLPFNHVWIRFQVQVAVLLSLAVVVGSLPVAAAGSWVLTAAGLA